MIKFNDDDSNFTKRQKTEEIRKIERDKVVKVAWAEVAPRVMFIIGGFICMCIGAICLTIWLIF